MKAYLANALFSRADFLYNDYLASYIRQEFPELTLYVPQENGEINDKTKLATSEDIAYADVTEIENSDFMIAVLDGQDIDSGVAAEIGIMYQLGRPIIGLYTDIRQKGTDNGSKIEMLRQDVTENQFQYRNLFVMGLIKRSGGVIVEEEDELMGAIDEVVAFGENQ